MEMIAAAIERMQALARKAQEETYDGKCAVVERLKVKDPYTKITAEEDVKTMEDVPCRLSYSSISAADQTETAAKTTQSIKIFMSPDVKIKPGTKLIVTQSGETCEYESSGVPAIYKTHQEIALTLLERYA